MRAAWAALGGLVVAATPSCSRELDEKRVPPPSASRLPQHAPGGPASCDDVGRFSGVASCCEGHYCGGHCFTDGCRCGDTFAGCFWPEVCCTDRCARPAQCGQ